MPLFRPRATVLLVEDDAFTRDIYRTILEHHGYVVLEAVDGQAGVEAARAARPDLILMDISLPRLDGWDAIPLLKGGDDTRPIPIVAVTGHVRESDRSRAAALGCCGFIAKPSPPSAVLREVGRVLRAVGEGALTAGQALR